eukprot:Ihof_evm3s421 gene=Ihof_evmTU3s421
MGHWFLRGNKQGTKANYAQDVGEDLYQSLKPVDRVLLSYLVITAPLLFISPSWEKVIIANLYGGTWFVDDVLHQWEFSWFNVNPAIGIGAQLRSLTSKAFNIWFGEYMHFCYFSFYGVLGGTWPLIWLLCPREDFDYTTTAVTLIYLSCLGTYLIVPAKGPFWTYDPPYPEEVGWFFSYITHAIDLSGSSRGTAMPSAHCALTMTNWICTMLYLRPLAAIYILVVPGLFLSTILQCTKITQYEGKKMMVLMLEALWIDGYKEVLPAWSPSAFLGQTVPFSNQRVTISQLIAEGGGSYVFLATDNGTGEKYALKRSVVDRLETQSIEQEIAFHASNVPYHLQTKLSNHKNIVRLINSTRKPLNGDKNYEYWLLMEYCPASILDAMNQKFQQGLSEDYIWQCFTSICEAVAHMHLQDPAIIHRDIKVENVLVNSQGIFKLCDFGSCTKEVHYPGKSRSRESIQEEIEKRTTLAYRSPEMVDLYLNAPIGEKLDVWALGCLLYKMCFFTSPFGDSALQIINGKYVIPANHRYSQHIVDLLAYIFVLDPMVRPDIFELCERVFAIEGKACPVTNTRLLSILEMFPDTPKDLVKNDLFVTRSVETTINNILTNNMAPIAEKPTVQPTLVTRLVVSLPSTSPSSNGESEWGGVLKDTNSTNATRGNTSIGFQSESTGDKVASKRRARPLPKQRAPLTGVQISLTTFDTAFSTDPFAPQ